MIEIIVGLFVMKLIGQLFPNLDETPISHSSILPFIENDQLKDEKKSDTEYWDWADDVEHDFDHQDYADDFGDEYIE